MLFVCHPFYITLHRKDVTYIAICRFLGSRRRAVDRLSAYGWLARLVGLHIWRRFSGCNLYSLHGLYSLSADHAVDKAARHDRKSCFWNSYRLC